MSRRLYYFLIVLLLGSTIAVSTAFAQVPILDVLKPTEQAEQSEAPVVDVEAKRQDAAAKFRVAQKELNSARAASPAGTPPPDAKVQEVDLRDQIERVLAQRLDAQSRKKELEATLAELERKLNELRENRRAKPQSRSFLMLDEYRDNLASERTRDVSVRATVASAVEALERAKSSAEEKDRRRLAAKDAIATNKDPAKATELANALANAELESELASELLVLRRQELENEKLAEQAYRLNIVFYQEGVAWLTKIARFDEQDLQAQIESLEKQSAKLKRELALAEPDAAFLEDRWFDARRRADTAPEKTPILVEEVEARRVAYLAQQQRVAVLNARIRRLAEMRTAWNRRFKVARQTADAPALVKWTEETDRVIEQLQSEARVQTLRSADIHKKLAVLAGKAEKEKADAPALAAWIEGQQEALRKISRAYELNVVNIGANLALHEKLLAEMRTDSTPTVARKLASAWQRLIDIWNFPVATVEDRPITIRKIVIGIVLLILGVFASRWLSRIFGYRLLTHVGVHESATSAIQTVTYYVLVLFFALFALRVANVPLTTFTILGGAVALGIGFGSQAIVNNFISGLILLAERPIRIGDLIQVDGLFAVVEKIGARSTRVKTGANLEIIVPNSKFLENNVTNWTLSNNMVRCEIQVGVVYGSPTRQVEELLIKAARFQELVLVDPSPFIWFREFGDNALIFQLNFWIQMTSLTRRLTIESHIRFEIDELFRQAGLVIAFPQRDIHLDAARPLDIRLLPPDPSVPEQEAQAMHEAA